MAKQIGATQKKHSVMGTPYWMAPEVIQMDGVQETPCDIWSVECTVLEMLTGEPPYKDSNPMGAMYKMVQNKHPPLPDDISPALKHFLLQCFQRDPAKRFALHSRLCTLSTNTLSTQTQHTY